MLQLERYIAKRYLYAAESGGQGRGFLRFITYVAIGGVAIGVAALLLSLSIVHGFSREIEAKIIGFGAHIEIENYQDEPLQDAEELEAKLSKFEHVTSIAPVVQEFVLLRHSANQIDGVVLWGARTVPPYLSGKVISGASSLQADSSGLDAVVIGNQLASKLQLSVGDVVTVFSMRRSASQTLDGAGIGITMPRIKQFSIGGIYETSLSNFDELYIFASLDQAKQLLAYGADEISRFDLTLDNAAEARTVAAEIEDTLGFPLMARSIFDVYRGLFAWVNLQEGIIPLVISVITLVAAFNIVGALLMIILEKTREIGILGSMGASGKTLRRLFLWLGLLIGIAGVILGELLAIALALLQKWYQIIPLPEEAYYMKTAPVEINPVDFAVVGLCTLLLCLVAAYLPARVASGIDPIRVIRFR